MKKARNSYSLEFKISAAKMSIHCGSIVNVANELKISRHTLEHWRKSYKDGKLTLKRSAASDAAKNEFSKLRKQIRELKIERDILKKALSIFSKNDS
nr:transposase [uncultured Flavobacterium sp.]